MNMMILKRGFDIIVSFAGLLMLGPIFAIIVLLVYIHMGSPVFFMQKRPGFKGKSFKMIKFRTLTNEKGPDGVLLPEDIRLTRLGAVLRAASLDELPELINVLRGDMSLVGPRPLRMYYLPLYNDFQSRRHDVKPGITGWAQVNGRNAISWEKKFELDVWYVDHWSFRLDIQILFLTLLKVLRRESTTASNGVFTEPFRGTGDKRVSAEVIMQMKEKDSF